jgi:hypothetical protein
LVAGGLIGTAPALAASAPTAHRITVHPQITPAGAPGPNVTFGCQTRPMDGTQGPRLSSGVMLYAFWIWAGW